MSNRVAEIGRKSPIELFENSLNLYGGIIRDANGLSVDDFKNITDDISKFIRENHYLVADLTEINFKKILNYQAKQNSKSIIHSIGVIQSILDENNLVKAAPEEKKECKVCLEIKLLESFPKFGGGNRTDTCAKCRGKAISEGLKAKKNRIKSKEDVQKDIEIKYLRAKNEEYFRKIEILNSPELMTEDEWFGLRSKSAGLYFMSAILKEQNTGELFNVIDQIDADSEEHAIGLFVLSEDVKNHIIISISHIKSKESC